MSIPKSCNVTICTLQSTLHFILKNRRDFLISIWKEWTEIVNNKINYFLWERHSSEDSFAPTIQQYQVQIPAMLLPFILIFYYIFKNGTSPVSFCLFSFFSNTNFTEKNCRRQQDSNPDRQSRRRARWPLDHHHDPFFTMFFVVLWKGL